MIMSAGMGCTLAEEIKEPQGMKEGEESEKAHEEEQEGKEKRNQREEPKFELRTVKTLNGCHLFLPSRLDGKNEEHKRENAEAEKKKEEKDKEKEKEEGESCFSVPGLAIVVPSPGHSFFYGIYRQKLRDARNRIERRKKRKPLAQTEGRPTNKKQHLANDTAISPSSSQPQDSKKSQKRKSDVVYCSCSSQCMTRRCACVAHSKACSEHCHKKKNSKCANHSGYVFSSQGTLTDPHRSLLRPKILHRSTHLHLPRLQRMCVAHPETDLIFQ